MAKIKKKGIYPIEFLNNIITAALPPHKLQLKLHQPVILLRNINQREGLCNGTRLIIRGFQKHFLNVEIAIGKHAGKSFYLQRIGINPTDARLPIELKRVQFPVRSAFAMTINKSQGATLEFVGIYLNEPVFSHGQLYVAMSRVSSLTNLFIATNSEFENVTRNVVFKEIF